MTVCIHGQEHPCQKCHRGPHALECNLNFRDRIRDGCNCQVILDYADRLEREGRPIPERAQMLRALQRQRLGSGTQREETR